jgi:hypothetical protein
VEKTNILSQDELMAIAIPVLKAKGQLFQKYKQVLARKAETEEEVLTVTSEGIETTNTAQPGDFIVQNPTEAKECYVIKAEKFPKRYELLDSNQDSEWKTYSPIGKVFAIELTPELSRAMSLDLPFEFMAAWGSPMTADAEDFLVCPPDYSEIYKIGNQEFHETYQIEST